MSFSKRIRVFDLKIMSLLVIEKHKLLLDESEYIWPLLITSWKPYMRYESSILQSQGLGYPSQLLNTSGLCQSYFGLICGLQLIKSVFQTIDDKTLCNGHWSPNLISIEAINRDASELSICALRYSSETKFYELDGILPKRIDIFVP